jgi:hypothetical protein
MLEASKAIYLATLQTPRPAPANPDDTQIQMSPSINGYDEREEFEMDLNLDDDCGRIKHGSPLRKRQIEEIEIDRGSRKRKRFRKMIDICGRCSLRLSGWIMFKKALTTPPQKEIQGAKKDWLIIVFLYKSSSAVTV